MKRFSGTLEAEVHFLSHDEDGRQTPVSTGYMGRISFDGEKDFAARHLYGGVAEVKPEDTVSSTITVAFPAQVDVQVRVGTAFSFREGRKVAQPL